MPTDTMTFNVENDRIFVFDRIFNVRREVLFEMYKQAKHFKAWLSDDDFEIVTCNMDFRENGSCHYSMKMKVESDPQLLDTEYWAKIVYKKIIEGQLITYTSYRSDAQGTLIDKEVPTIMSLEFIDKGDQCKLICRDEFRTKEEFDSVQEMGTIEALQNFWDRLENYAIQHASLVTK